jgi:hypothetical protein
MAYAPEDKLLIYAQAIRGLVQLEPSPEKRLKYVDFIDIYADLDENERQIYSQLYPQEEAAMAGFAQRFTEKGREEGREEGVQRGEARILTALLRLRFGELPAAVQVRVDTADADTLLRWSERVLTAATLDEIFAD